jgi:hypothetical protein
VINLVTHGEVVHNYFHAVGDKRNHYNKGCNVFFEGDTLYSYDYHFILAQKIKNGYLLNGEGSTHSTSQHQNITRLVANGDSWDAHKINVFNNCVIPFSAIHSFLRHIGLLVQLNNDIQPEHLRKFEILEVQKDTYENVSYRDKDGDMKIRSIHHLGGSLVKYGRYYLLSGIDSGSKNYSYYLILLKKPAKSIEEAFRQLAGNLTDKEYEEYQDRGSNAVMRQGEYFFVSEPNLSTRELTRNSMMGVQKNVDLSHGVGNPHTATEYIKTRDKGIYVRRTVRHPEHRMLSFYNVWHRVVQNIQRISWSAGGRVD